MRATRLLFLLLIPFLLPRPASTQSVSVFGPGTISLEGDNIYKGAFTPDGATFYFFRKVTDGQEDYRIFRSQRDGNNWTTAEQVTIGEGGHSDLYPAISPDGAWFAFSSYRPAGGEYDDYPNANLWIAPMTQDGPGEPRLLEDLSTPGNYHPGPTFSPDGTLHFKSTTRDWSTTYANKAHFSEGRFEAYESDTKLDPWIDWRSGEVHVWDVVLHPAGDLAMLDVSEFDADGRLSPTDQWVSVSRGGTWSEPVRLGGEVNTPEYENFVVFSPDGSTIHFVRGFSTYLQMSTAEVRARAADAPNRPEC